MIPLSKMMQTPYFEWVAPGFLLATVLTGTPRSQNRDLGHPRNIRARHFHLLRWPQVHVSSVENISKEEHPHRDLSTTLRFGRDDKGESRYGPEQRSRD